MRLGRIAWLVLGIGVFVIAFATLFTIYSRNSGEQEELENSLAGAQAQLTTLISGKTSLESQLAEQQSNLAEAQALLSSARGSFPSSGASIEYSEVLSEFADDFGLEVMSMSAKEPRETEIEDITFITISFEMEVEGEVNSVLGMIDAIAKDELFASATVEAVDMSIPRPKAAWEEEGKPLARIKFVGYSYEGE
jgi:hypothetical protein